MAVDAATPYQRRTISSSICSSDLPLVSGTKRSTNGMDSAENTPKIVNDFIMNGLIALGAGIAALTGIGGGIGIGIATGKATEAISRQPEAASKIQTNLLLGAALAEGTAIFGFVVALLIILFLG